MATYATYPATAYYSEYVAQPAYQIEPHPYGANYTTTARLQPDQYERPSSRRTVSPASSNEYSDSSSRPLHHRRRRSSIYLDPDSGHIVVTGGSRSPSRRDRDHDREREQRSREREQQREREAQRQYDLEKEDRRRRRDKERREAAAAVPIPSSRSEKSSKPIPFSRSSTMPTGHTIAPAYETRGRRPIIMSEQYEDRGEVSARIPIGPVPIIEHAGSRSRHHGSRRYSTSRPGSGSSYEHQRPATPQGYASNDEELHRRASQRSRANDDVRTSRGGREFSSSAPERGPHEGSLSRSAAASSSAAYDSYGSSYGSSNSGFTPPPPPSALRHRRMSSSGSRSSAEPPVIKNLRWADQETRKGVQDQNERINQRPKYGR
ncbi:hypothetical protein RB596_000159 [Gaeumannomyces avenae]